MRERLLELFPEFDLIQNAEMREKALQTYELALQESGWTPDELTQIPFTLIINPCPASYVDHVRAVTLTAIAIAQVFEQVYGDRLPVDMDLLVTGALLHDVGKLLEYEKGGDGLTVQSQHGALLRHPFSGMELAGRCGLSPEVQHVIAAHAGEGDKMDRITEATIVNHSDFVNFHSLQRAMPKKQPAARMGQVQ